MKITEHLSIDNACDGHRTIIASARAGGSVIIVKTIEDDMVRVAMTLKGDQYYGNSINDYV